jgi:hypothetical protein
MYKYLYKIPLFGLNILVVTILLNFVLEVMSKQELPEPITISLNSIKSLNTSTFHISGQFLGYCFVLFAFLINIFIKGFVQIITEIDYYFNQITPQVLKNTIIGLLCVNCIILLLLVSYKIIMYMFNTIYVDNKNTINLIKTQNNIEHEYEINSTDSIFTDEHVKQHLSNIDNINIKTIDSDIDMDIYNEELYESKPKTINESKPKTINESKPKTINESKPKTINESKPKTINKFKLETINESKLETINESKLETINDNEVFNEVFDEVVDEDEVFDAEVFDEFIDEDYIPTKKEISNAKQNSIDTFNMSLVKYKGNNYYVDDTKEGKVYVAVPVGDDDFIAGKEVGLFDMNNGNIKLYKDTKTNFNPIFG